MANMDEMMGAQITLHSLHKRRYVSAMGNGSAVCYQDRQTAEEIYSVVGVKKSEPLFPSLQMSDTKVALQSTHGTFLTAHPDGHVEFCEGYRKVPQGRQVFQMLSLIHI